jgi:hypothetical protein
LNYWARRTAILHLSELGKATFAEVFDGQSVEVFVEWADDLGLWIFREQVNEATTSVMLVKWSHFDTAVLDVVLQEPKQAKVLGFRK